MLPRKDERFGTVGRHAKNENEVGARARRPTSQEGKARRQTPIGVPLSLLWPPFLFGGVEFVTLPVAGDDALK